MTTSDSLQSLLSFQLGQLGNSPNADPYDWLAAPSNPPHSPATPYNESLGSNVPGWIAVRERFDQFHGNLMLTGAQQADGHTKRNSVISCLNNAYYSTSCGLNNSFYIGSWAKETAVRPPRDVDLYFLLPVEVYHRFQAYSWSRQSALLQEVKNVLAATFGTTDINADRHVVIVNFGSYSVEVAPAFLLNKQGRYWICDTKNGGTYKETSPWDEVAYLESVDSANARNLRPLIRMLKAWQAACAVPLTSFQIELVAAEFLQQSPWRLNSFFWFDWLVRDFFSYLYGRANGIIFAPGTAEVMWLGSAWQSRAMTAYSRAVKACEHEHKNEIGQAGDEWQKIFGNDIPRWV